MPSPTASGRGGRGPDSQCPEGVQAGERSPMPTYQGPWDASRSGQRPHRVGTDTVTSSPLVCTFISKANPRHESWAGVCGVGLGLQAKFSSSGAQRCTVGGPPPHAGLSERARAGGTDCPASAGPLLGPRPHCRPHSPRRPVGGGPVRTTTRKGRNVFLRGENGVCLMPWNTDYADFVTEAVAVKQ